MSPADADAITLPVILTMDVDSDSNLTATGNASSSDDAASSVVSLLHKPIFTYVTEGVILTTVSSFGLVGNVMSIFVLMRVAVQEKREKNYARKARH